MEPLTTMLLGAITAAAGALAGGVADAAGGDAWTVAKDKLLAWVQFDERRRGAAFERALEHALASVGKVSPSDDVGRQALTLLDNQSAEGRAFRQVLVEELLFSARPNLGRLADQYRRQIRFLSFLHQQPLPAWPDIAPRLQLFVGTLRRELANERSLRPLLLEQAELESIDLARASAAAVVDSAQALARIEGLLAEFVALPRISASINAAEGANINQAPITVVMGDQHTYTIAPVVPADLEALYRRYCAFLIGSFGTLDFRGIVQMQNVVQLQLEDMYVPLRAHVQSHATAGRPASGGDILGKDTVNPDRSLHILVRDEPYLVILGDPGAGKSTVVRMIMLTLAQGKATSVFGLADEWLPIFFPVASFAEVRGDPGSREIAPLAYLRSYYQGRQQPDYTPLFERALLAGRALVLFDGLDEVREDRLAIVHCLEDFMRAWDAPGNRFVATSRIAGYDDAPLNDVLFRRTTVEPFRDDEIRQFARNWSMAFERAGAPHTRPDDAELLRRIDTRTHALSDAVFAVPSVTDLARNPLLLTILALIHNQGTRLPDRRVDLYRLCVEALAETWNRARALTGRPVDVFLGDEKLDERFVVNLLGPAALWIHETNPGGIVEERELEQQLTRILREIDGLPPRKAAELAADFLRMVNRETGLLQERGHRRYSFLHLTFEEYLAARALLESATVIDTDAEIHRYATVPGWREVIRLALASVSQKEAQRLLLHLLQAPTDVTTHGRPVILAGECLLDIGRTGTTRRAWDAVITALLATIVDPHTPIASRVEAGHILGRLGDPRLLNPATGQPVGIGEYPEVEDYWCPIDAGPFWFGDDQVDPPRRSSSLDKRSQPPRFDPTKLTQIELPNDMYIGRYPVTNTEFARFLEANGPDGYDPLKPWWAPKGKTFLHPGGHPQDDQETFIRQPRYWDTAQYNSPSQPIIGITWYEAAAYCHWLTAEGYTHGWLPSDQIIRMPTSLEWERAARHTDTRPFPWGDATPTPDHANYAEVDIKASSPVGCFPMGRAVCGADDLVGNVLEWLATANWADTEQQPQKDFTSDDAVLFSFTCYNDGLDQMCCGARYMNNPCIKGYLGFRIVQSRALTE